eukprot:scaffold1706_cov29-Tisochrysis_lutea.AAC.4
MCGSLPAARAAIVSSRPVKASCGLAGTSHPERAHARSAQSSEAERERSTRGEPRSRLPSRWRGCARSGEKLWAELEASRCERGKSLGGTGREAAKRGRGSPGLPPGGCSVRMPYNTNCLPLISGLACPLAPRCSVAVHERKLRPAGDGRKFSHFYFPPPFSAISESFCGLCPRGCDSPARCPGVFTFTAAAVAGLLEDPFLRESRTLRADARNPRCRCGGGGSPSDLLRRFSSRRFETWSRGGDSSHPTREIRKTRAQINQLPDTPFIT